MVIHTFRILLQRFKTQVTKLSLAGAATSIIFVATNICCDKTFVTTKICLSWQAYFCHDKRHVLSKQTCLSWQTCVCHDNTFVTTKMILVAALANDTKSRVCLIHCHSVKKPTIHLSIKAQWHVLGLKYLLYALTMGTCLNHLWL